MFRSLKNILPGFASTESEALFSSNSDFRKAILLLFRNNLFNFFSPSMSRFLFNLLIECSKIHKAYKMASVIRVVSDNAACDIRMLQLLAFAKDSIVDISRVVKLLITSDEYEKINLRATAFVSIIFKVLAGFEEEIIVQLVKAEIMDDAFGVVNFIEDIFHGTIDLSEPCIIPFADSDSLNQVAVALSSPMCPNHLILIVNEHSMDESAERNIVDVLRKKAPLTTEIMGLSKKVEEVCCQNNQRDIVLQLYRILFIFEIESNNKYFLSGLNHALDLIETYYDLFNSGSEHHSVGLAIASNLLQYFMTRLLSSKACFSVPTTLKYITSQNNCSILQYKPQTDFCVPRPVQTPMKALKLGY